MTIITNLNLKGYNDLTVLLEQDGKRWVASVPSIPGCHTQGDSIDQAVKRLREAIKLCPRPAKMPQVKVTDVKMLDDSVGSTKLSYLNVTWTYGRKAGWTTFTRGATSKGVKWSVHSSTLHKFKRGTQICPFKQSVQFVEDVAHLAMEHLLGKVPEVMEWRKTMKPRGH